MFVVGFVAFDADLIGMAPLIPIPANVELGWDIANWIIWVVFVIDVYGKYRRSENLRSFLRCNWLDLLFLIPLFRVLLLLRVIRLLRLVRMLRMAGAVSEFLEIHFFTMQKILGFERLRLLYTRYVANPERRRLFQKRQDGSGRGDSGDGGRNGTPK